jgi:hypothetical protein
MGRLIARPLWIGTPLAILMVLGGRILFWPRPAWADLTAVYSQPNNRQSKIEIAANGDMRLGNGSGEPYYLIRDGEAYYVAAGPGHPIVMRADDIARAYAGQPTPSGGDWPEPVARVPGPRVSINGRSGVSYVPEKGADKGETAWIVLSDDPALAPLAEAWKKQLKLDAAIARPEYRRTAASMAAVSALLNKGAPLRLFFLNLASVSRAPVKADRFVIPRPPLSIDEVRDYLGVTPDADEPIRLNPNSDIKRAIFVSGALWLVTDQGALSVVTEATGARQRINLPGKVLDICLFQGAPLIATANSGQDWTLQHFRDGGWADIGHVPGQGDALMGMACDSATPILLTDHRRISVAPGGVRAVRLAQPLRPGVISTLLMRGTDIFVGIDAGEWGGGLIRIDTAGHMLPIERNESGGLCGGPLNAACDPVNGIAPLPSRPECLVAAIGLTHLMSHGRLTGICGATVKRLYFVPYTTGEPRDTDRGRDEPFETVPFYGLAQGKDGIWAVAQDGLYRLNRSGKIRFVPFPRFQNYGGVSASFANPEIVLVRTSINGRVSLSGSVPMIIPRR